MQLIAANADVNKANNNGTTPLFFACQKGHAEVVTVFADYRCGAERRGGAVLHLCVHRPTHAFL